MTPVLKGVRPRKVGRKVHLGEATYLAVHHVCSRAIVRSAMGLQYHSLASFLSSLSCLIFTLGKIQYFAYMFLCAQRCRDEASPVDTFQQYLGVVANRGVHESPLFLSGQFTRQRHIWKQLKKMGQTHPNITPLK